MLAYILLCFIGIVLTLALLWLLIIAPIFICEVILHA